MEIAHDNAEIICLQEVDHYDEIYKPRLEALAQRASAGPEFGAPGGAEKPAAGALIQEG